MRTLRAGDDPLVGHVRQPYFVEVYFRRRRLDNAFLTQIALDDFDDLDGVAREAMMSNEGDVPKKLYRYLVRVYECRYNREGKPRRGHRITDYIPRDEEGGHGG